MRKALIGIALAVVAVVPVAQSVRADTMEATCEMRKDGEKQKGKSGPCTFGQRQGYIDIDLRNGETLRLSPAGGGGQYRDQKGNKVRRVDSGARSQEFRWDGGKHLTVTFLGNGYGSHDYGNDGYGNGGYGAGGYAAGRERDDYQRGYRDGLAGRYDQYDHTQAYKDGVRAGENEARSGGGYREHDGHGGDHGGYTIERIGNGDFEIKWKGGGGCIADYDARGRSTGYTNCSEDMKRRSDEIARNRTH